MRFIKVEHTLYKNLSSKKRDEPTNRLRKTLVNNEKALGDVSRFWRGGAAGCYDLGFVVTQRIYRIGEDKFAEMASKLTEEERQALNELISVGLEYGDNNNDGKPDDKRGATEFQKLFRVLSLKVENSIGQ